MTRLHRKLTRIHSSNNEEGELILENEVIGGEESGHVRTEIQFGNLWVSRLLTEDEEDKLDDF